MPIQISRPGVPQGETFTAKEDIIEILPDGRNIQLLAKGQSVPMAEAIAKGYVKPQKQAGPTESKGSK